MKKYRSFTFIPKKEDESDTELEKQIDFAIELANEQEHLFDSSYELHSIVVIQGRNFNQYRIVLQTEVHNPIGKVETPKIDDLKKILKQGIDNRNRTGAPLQKS